MRLRLSGALRQTPPMFFARRGLRLFLAALLIFSQQQAVLHLLGHGLAQLSAQAATRDSSRDSTDPQELVCAKCLAIAHLDHAASGAVHTIEPVESTPERVAEPVVAHFDPAFFASYRSRAPPVLS